MKKFPILTVASELFDRFGVELDEDKIISWSLSCLRKIGNADIRLRVIKVLPEKQDASSWTVELPCNCYSVECVTLPFELGKTVDSTYNYLGFKTYNIENWIEAFKRNLSEYYLRGSMVKYTKVGNTLHFIEYYPELNVLYKEQILDEDGLPLLSAREVEACVYYCLWSNDLKQGRILKDQASLQMASSMWYPMLLKAISQARVGDENMSQNQWNEVLDVMAKWGGTHSYNVSSTKPIE